MSSAKSLKGKDLTLESYRELEKLVEEGSVQNLQCACKTDSVQLSQIISGQAIPQLCCGADAQSPLYMGAGAGSGFSLCPSHRQYWSTDGRWAGDMLSIIRTDACSVVEYDAGSAS